MCDSLNFFFFLDCAAGSAVYLPSINTSSFLLKPGFFFFKSNPYCNLFCCPEDKSQGKILLWALL